MATSLTSSFSGKATEFFLSAMEKSKTLTAGITLDTNVEYKYVPRGFDMTNIIQTGETCTWDDGGTTTISEEPKELKGFYVNKTECFKDYVSNWNDVSSTALPAEVESAIAAKVSDSIASSIENILWKASTTAGTVSGNSYTLGLFDGYNKILKAGGAISVGGTALSKSNIIAQLDRVYDAMPEEIKSQDKNKLIIFVSYKAEGYLRQALSAQLGHDLAKDELPLYLGIEVRGVAQFTNVMAAGLKESFHYASNFGVDSASVNILNMFPTTLEQNARVQAAGKQVVAVTNKSQVVLYNF